MVDFPFSAVGISLSSQALEAQKNGWFKEEIVPVTIQTKGKEPMEKGIGGQVMMGWCQCQRQTRLWRGDREGLYNLNRIDFTSISRYIADCQYKNLFVLKHIQCNWVILLSFSR